MIVQPPMLTTCLLPFGYLQKQDTRVCARSGAPTSRRYYCNPCSFFFLSGSSFSFDSVARSGHRDDNLDPACHQSSLSRTPKPQRTPVTRWNIAQLLARSFAAPSAVSHFKKKVRKKGTEWKQKKIGKGGSCRTTRKLEKRESDDLLGKSRRERECREDGCGGELHSPPSGFRRR